MEDMIRINGLSKAYRDFSLKEVNLSLPKGCVMGLIGENGAGKSTLIKSMLDIVRRDEGQVELLGMELDHNGPQIRQETGVVFGESHFHDFLNALHVSGIMKRMFTGWDEGLFKEYLRRFSLPERKKIREYSTGMKMKLSIAAALSHYPRLLILDEALNGLDPVVRDEILDLIFEFIEDGEHSVLMSSHITSDLDKVSDYITMLHKGRILFSEEKDVLLEDMGILRCGAGEAGLLDGLEVTGLRQGAYQMEGLVRNRRQLQALYPELTIDRAGLEDIMLFYVRGTKE